MSITNQHNPNCPICSESEVLPLCTSNGYEILRCKTCACDFVWPMPDEKMLKKYYDSMSYFQGDTKGSYSNYDFDTEGVLSLFRDFLLSIPNSTGKKILDIGCAFGSHLAIAAEQGWEAWGVELSDYARETAQSRHGEKIQVVGSINSLPKMEFDLVMMMDVIEHLPNPYELFIELFLQGVIGKKTQLVVTTPNARSIDAIADPVSWAYRHPPAHLVYFSANSLSLFLSNLECVDVSIQGIYPTEYKQAYDYLDEKNALTNHEFKNHAGLMAIAQGFDTSLHKLSALFESQLDRVKNSETKQIYQQIFAIQRQLIQKHVLEEQNLKTKIAYQAQVIIRKEENILKIQQSKWYRLGSALTTRPLTLHGCARIAYLSISLIIPKKVRIKLTPIVLKLRQRYL
jgi:2-polyprenyl-3-methyl-5-hydroxy-6-metoxy-1,4-benzoquinol methylase